MLNEIKNKIVLSVQRQRMYDPVLKDTVDKVLVTFNDGTVNGYLADEWDNLLSQVDLHSTQISAANSGIFLPNSNRPFKIASSSNPYCKIWDI